MRLAIYFQLMRESWLPLNHQDLLTGLVYRLLNVSDADFARFLHDEGYALEEGGAKRFKLFCFSNLRIPRQRREIVGDRFRVWPGALTWFLASPRADILTHSATGLLTVGTEVQVGTLPLTISRIEALPQPAFAPTTRFTCLTPIVASLPNPTGGPARYLRPGEEAEFSETVRRNLLHKYRLVHGAPPADENLRLAFDAGYVRKDAHGGTKKITYKNIDVVGAFVPFTLTGSMELMETAWECGLGEKNGIGFGMVDVRAGEEA